MEKSKSIEFEDRLKIYYLINEGCSVLQISRILDFYRNAIYTEIFGKGFSSLAEYDPYIAQEKRDISRRNGARKPSRTS